MPRIPPDILVDFASEIVDIQASRAPLEKYEPIAFQVIGDTETIVLRSSLGQQIRIWAPYFDFLTAFYASGSWWRSCQTKNDSSDYSHYPLVFKVHHGVFRDGINAIICPIDSQWWPEVDLEGFERDCGVVNVEGERVNTDDDAAD